MAKRNKHIGSSLDSLLEETGDLAETRARAIKDVTAWEAEKDYQDIVTYGVQLLMPEPGPVRAWFHESA